MDSYYYYPPFVEEKTQAKKTGRNERTIQTKVMVPSSQTLTEEDLAVQSYQVTGRMDIFTVTIHKKMRDQEWRV